MRPAQNANQPLHKASASKSDPRSNYYSKLCFWLRTKTLCRVRYLVNAMSRKNHSRAESTANGQDLDRITRAFSHGPGKDFRVFF